LNDEERIEKDQNNNVIQMEFGRASAEANTDDTSAQQPRRSEAVVSTLGWLISRLIVVGGIIGIAIFGLSSAYAGLSPSNQLEIAKEDLALGAYQDAEDCLHRAITIENLSFWSSHETLPDLYHSLGTAQFNLSNYAEAVESFEKEVDWRKQLPESDPADIAFSCYCAGSFNLIVGNSGKAEDFLKESCDLYDACDENAAGSNAGRAYATYAKARFADIDYATATNYHEKAVPLLRDNTVWGNYNDSGNALLLAVSYKQLAIASEKTGDPEQKEYYEEKYRVFTYLRDLSDEDVENALSPAWTATGE
jgi:tetratricopeptide (TPR) repeat protein